MHLYLRTYKWTKRDRGEYGMRTEFMNHDLLCEPFQAIKPSTFKALTH